jgi:ADP-ribose pyrophosphatase YjhB (NUDIX family)
MEPAKHFKFCPRCGHQRSKGVGTSPLRCGACGFLYYFNPTIAVAGFIFAPDGRALFIRRAKEPAKGKLAVPGGFVDVGESAEEALRRETREEVNVELADLSYLCSHVNSYDYGGVTYPVLDLFFTALAVQTNEAKALDGVESIQWLDPQAVNLDEMAFTSIRSALGFLRKSGKPDVSRRQNS